ncbi:MAG: hypothetical protein ACI82Z_002012, partial [Cellvibrionaceae bacterium]
ERRIINFLSKKYQPLKTLLCMGCSPKCYIRREYPQNPLVGYKRTVNFVRAEVGIP